MILFFGSFYPAVPSFSNASHCWSGW